MSLARDHEYQVDRNRKICTSHCSSRRASGGTFRGRSLKMHAKLPSERDDRKLLFLLYFHRVEVSSATLRFRFLWETNERLLRSNEQHAEVQSDHFVSRLFETRARVCTSAETSKIRIALDESAMYLLTGLLPSFWPPRLPRFLVKWDERCRRYDSAIRYAVTSM